MSQRVAVIGASGDQGAAQVRALVQVGHQPIAISRSGRATQVDRTAVESRAADFSEPLSLAKALTGAEALFVNLPSTSFQQAEPLIAGAGYIAAAARSCCIGQLVFNTSMPVPACKLGFAAQDARHEMRRLLLASGICATSIEPVVYLDNLMKKWAWPTIERTGTIVYPHHPELDVSWICHADLAALMIAVLGRADLNGRCFAVGGAETVRLPQLTAILADAWDRPLHWRSQPIDEFCDGIRQAFGPRASLETEHIVSELSRIYHWYNEAPEHPFRVDMAKVLAELPVRLTPIAEWARANRSPPAS